MRDAASSSFNWQALKGNLPAHLRPSSSAWFRNGTLQVIARRGAGAPTNTDQSTLDLATSRLERLF